MARAAFGAHGHGEAKAATAGADSFMNAAKGPLRRRRMSGKNLFRAASRHIIDDLRRAKSSLDLVAGPTTTQTTTQKEEKKKKKRRRVKSSKKKGKHRRGSIALTAPAAGRR